MIDQELDVVGTAFADVHLDADARDVISRGRKLRRRRKAVPALATAGILAASLSLAAVTQSSAPSAPSAAGSHTLGYHGSVVNVDEAGFSVHTDVANGTIVVTFKDLFDPSALQAVLAKAGIPAAFHEMPSVDVVSATPCRWTGAATLPSDQVVDPWATDGDVFTIHPAKMPAGSVLGFVYLTMRFNGGHTQTVGVGPSLLSGEPTGCVTN